MFEFELYCFAQSGNAYRAALMLNLIGADWQPIWVDFFAGGATPYLSDLTGKFKPRHRQQAALGTAIPSVRQADHR